MKHTVVCPHVDAAERYVDDVLSGRVVSGANERLACERHRRDLRRSDEGGPWIFDPVRAERVCRFLETLPHVSGEWAAKRSRIRLEGWQAFAIASMFGWVSRETGLRRFTTAYVEVARKNGKSTLLGGTGLWMVALDGEAGAEVYSAASTKEQARKVFDPARLMAEGTPELRLRAGVKVQAHRILGPSASVFLPLAAQTNSLDGLNPSCGVIDEVHAHKTRDVVDVIRSGMGARAQPLLVMITTAGANIGGVCYEERTYLEKVLRGVIEDDKYFGVIYAIDDADDPFDPAVWRKANPNLGVSVKVEFLAEEAQKARHTPTRKGEFLRKHCCRWSAAGVAAFDLDAWRSCGDASLRLEDFAGRRGLMIGLDGSKNDDLTGLAALAWDDAGRLMIWEEAFGTSATIRAEGNEHLAAWAEDPDCGLHEIDGALIDTLVVEARLREIIAAIAPGEIAYDPLYLLQMAQRLEQGGRVLMVEQRQNPMSLDPALRMLEGLIADRRVVHRGSPLMDWCISNARSKPAGEFVRLFKQGPAMKIDPVQAVITGLARMEAPEEAKPESYLARSRVRFV